MVKQTSNTSCPRAELSEAPSLGSADTLSKLLLLLIHTLLHTWIVGLTLSTCVTAIRHQVLRNMCGTNTFTQGLNAPRYWHPVCPCCLSCLVLWRPILQGHLAFLHPLAPLFGPIWLSTIDICVLLVTWVANFLRTGFLTYVCNFYFMFLNFSFTPLNSSTVFSCI